MDNWISFVLVKVIFVIIIMAISVINDYYICETYSMLVQKEQRSNNILHNFVFFMVQLLQILLESHVNPLYID